MISLKEYKLKSTANSNTYTHNNRKKRRKKIMSTQRQAKKRNKQRNE